MPPSVMIIAKIANPYMQTYKLIPEILLMANAPRYKIDVRFTTTYNNNQKTAIIIATVEL